MSISFGAGLPANGEIVIPLASPVIDCVSSRLLKNYS